MPCWYCGTSLKGGKLTRDHVEPKSKVGNKTRFVDACGDCNSRKGDHSLEDWRWIFWGYPREFYGEKMERLHKFI